MNLKKITKKNILLFCIILAAAGMTTLVSAQIGTKIEKNETIATPSNAKKTIATPSEIKKDTYTGFKTENNEMHYYKDGKKITDRLMFIKGELYYFDKNGEMKTGWYESDRTNWIYYFDEFGESQIGWIYDEDAWYYLEDHKLATGWKEILSEDGTEYWFYFDENGKMYADCETPDGYYVNEDGVWIEDIDIPIAYEEDSFGWEKDPNAEPGQISGLTIAGNPAELYMLSIAGETSGLANLSAIATGDKGRAYGVCQFDYRYDLVGFMNFAYDKHPDLWPAFSKYLNYKAGNPDLKNNSDIGNAFLAAMNVDYETAMSDQLEYLSSIYWTPFKEKLNTAGFDLDNRHIAVSAALFSINVNCGSQPNVFINNLSPDMTDEEMIREIYHLRNTVFANQKVGSAFKGTTTRYKKSEPQMALDLLYGYITIDSHKNYGGGVEWHGNPFYNAITTIPNEGSIVYEEETVNSTPANAPMKKTISFTQTELEQTEEITETLEINETEELESQPSTIYQSEENMIQLSDGTWVSKMEYGPGYEYMELEETTEETLPQETETVVEIYEFQSENIEQEQIDNKKSISFGNTEPQQIEESETPNIIIMETEAEIGPGIGL